MSLDLSLKEAYSLCQIHEIIRRQLEELQDTILLGMKRLKMIRIASHLQNRGAF